MAASIHLLRGNPSRLTADRLLSGETKAPVEVPDRPGHLTGEALLEWDRITGQLEALGLVAKIDRAMLALYCSAWSDVVLCEKKIADLNASSADGVGGFVSLSPRDTEITSIWLQIRAKAYSQIWKFGSEFGMSPLARSRTPPRVQQDVDPAGDEWSEKGL